MIKYLEISRNCNLLKNIETLYESAFPRDERRDFAQVLELLETTNGTFGIVAATDAESFQGFISYWHFDEFVYIEHFAVCNALRGKGVGSKFLSWFIKGHVSAPVVLEVEVPLDEISEKRINFYRHLGFKLWHELEYVQPAYDDSRNPMELKLMTIGNVSLNGLQRATELIKKEVYGILK